MLRFGILFLAVMVSLPALAQKVEDHLIKKTTDQGLMYFISDLKYTTCKGVETEQDFTYIATPADDSVTFNFTIISKSFKGKPKQVQLQIASQTWTVEGSDMELFFMEKKKKDWISRVSFRFPEALFIELCASGQLTWQVTYEDGTCSITLSEKYQEVLTDIHQMIQAEAQP